MTQLVLDASVVVKWVFPDPSIESHATRAMEVLQGLKSGEITVLQPPHWLAEVAAVVARLDPGIAQQAVALLYAMKLPVLEELEVYKRACELAIQLNHHVFDTLYHAVALCQPETFLLTADDRYYVKARSIGGMIHLQDFRLRV